jgi:hypothetical protein
MNDRERRDPPFQLEVKDGAWQSREVLSSR